MTKSFQILIAAALVTSVFPGISLREVFAADPAIVEWETVEDDDCQNFKLYRSTTAFITNPQGQQEIATVSCIASSFSDANVQAGATYFYSLFIFDTFGNYSEPYTAQVSVPTSAGAAPAGGGGSSGGGGGGSYSPSSGGGGFGAGTQANNSGGGSYSTSGMKLVNDQGTYFLISNGKKQGITNPGMLASYGFEFKDARTATVDEISLPQGALLLPADGSLVKSNEDPTVYLISGGQRRAFVSAGVFSGLGHKFNSVLLVTNPELQALPKGDDLNDSQAPHSPGLNINREGTIYWISGDSRLFAYPSLEVYNSWNKDNDFSAVVPANAADMALPVGGIVPLRVIE